MAKQERRPAGRRSHRASGTGTDETKATHQPQHPLISEPPTSEIRQTDGAHAQRSRRWTGNSISAAFAVTALGALPWPAAAQAPPRDNYKSSIWSSQDESLYELDLLTSRAFDELLPVRSNSLEIEALAPWSLDILTCEPQSLIAIDP